MPSLPNQPSSDERAAPQAARAFGQLGAEAREAVGVPEVEDDLLQLLLGSNEHHTSPGRV